MSFINVGARTGNGDDVKTKKALTELVKANSAELYFYGTSQFTPFQGGVKDIDGGIILSVTGPNPYTNRKWYATVRKENGKIVVK